MSMGWWSDPVRRGLVLLCLAVGCVGFALGANQTVVVNYFDEVLKFSGPEFGYITAIREVPGFLLIFLVALLYRLSLPHVTALALVALALGYWLFATATSFWSVAPWVVLSSFGYHTLLQTQNALAMSLVTEGRSGSMMGRVGAFWSWGSMVALASIGLGFHFGNIGYLEAFRFAAIAALLGACAVFFFPNLRDGVALQRKVEREPIVFRREYWLFYLLKFLDGARMQIFFSFGIWVLVNNYHLNVEQVAQLTIVSSTIVAFLTPYIGRLMDRYGERVGLGMANIGYVVALAAYALVDNVWLACGFYVVYLIITQPAEFGAAMYLRKIAPYEDIGPSLAMGLSVAHAAAVVVPVLAGYILNFVGYQVPFLIGAVIAMGTFFVTRQLHAESQKSPRRVAQEMAAAD